MCVRILAGQSLEPDEEGLDIDTNTIIQNLYPDNDHSQDSTDESDEESVQHKLVFKCIGAAHEKPRQEFLKSAETKLHKERAPVIVRLRPEPTNDKDRNAVAIDMNYGTGWNCVGYIARFSGAHLIFRLYWAKIGYYPLINITRKGQWEKICYVSMSQCTINRPMIVLISAL